LVRFQHITTKEVEMMVLRILNLNNKTFKDINIEKYKFTDFEKTIEFYSKVEFIKYQIIRN
jgi:hypothetical protein